MIGILGGTFDPIHYGHLRPAEQVLRAIGLDEIRFIPAAIPPHRAIPVASCRHRLRMVQLAVAPRPGFCVDDRETRVEGPSYTVRTLESLRAELGSQILCLIIGADAFAGLESWYQWNRLFELAHIVVVERPAAPMPHSSACLPAWARDRVCDSRQALSKATAGLVLLQHVDPQDISSTSIRDMIKKGESVQGLFPDAVWEYIRANQLYGYEKQGS